MLNNVKMMVKYLVDINRNVRAVIGGVNSWCCGVVSLALLVTLTGCVTSLDVTGSLPTPLVDPMPARIGVYYSDEFKTFAHEESISEQGTFKIRLGDHNFRFFEGVLGGMFESVVHVGEPPVTGDVSKEIDGVLVPKIIKYGFLTPGVSGLKFYSASIHYRVTLYDMAGKEIGDWVNVGYGKSESQLFGKGEALQKASEMAIRDGGAKLVTGLQGESGVKAWLAGVRDGEVGG